MQHTHARFFGSFKGVGGLFHRVMVFGVLKIWAPLSSISPAFIKISRHFLRHFTARNVTTYDARWNPGCGWRPGGCRATVVKSMQFLF